jgi:predicted Zn-dependent protease
VGVNSARADTMPFTRKPGVVKDRAEFLELLNGLSIGLSASEGVFRRNRFMHPDLGFTIRFPDGWETRNTHTAVGAVSPRHDAQVVLEFGGSGKDIRGAAEKFIEKSQREGLRLEGLEEVKIQGLDALRTKGTATTPRGSFHAVVTFIGFDDVIFRIMGLALSRQLEGVFINTARSFRRITPRQLAQIKETRLRIARAQKGETLVALSSRTGNEWNVNMTAVMNNVHTTQQLEEGYGVKIAVAEVYEPKGKGSQRVAE